ncbi:taurine ABC transporter permease [Hoeflea sp. BAL378]|uniref:ABC transporter permease n=1 Tax=Hoeflea sp. BAL378 TaxID=1547437 RepID=UPI0005141B01|nr:ABC transporter permease subunit [Hoeflea sp. BAL378]KGF67978.1 taurine ABC transporter permease [Hoeflea sp. BAL378]
MIVLLLYVAIFALAFVAYRFWERKRHHLHDFASLKTVTFGDESAVSPNRFASVVSIIALFAIWGAFTGSAITPLHVPGPFVGDSSFAYTARNAAGETDEATVYMRVYRVGEDVPLPELPADQAGFAMDDALKIGAWRSVLARPNENDTGGEEDGYSVIAIDGQPIAPGDTLRFADGEITMTSKGSLSIKPDKGWQMEPIWLPAPEAVVARLGEIASEGYKNVSLWEHLGYSLGRVIGGFVIGSILGIPLGYAMGLSNWFRGWFDPIVEFMRPVPPLALIPLIIIWFGIGEEGKIILLFLAALWIMTIAARAGVSGVRISKVHAAYSLGASKWQILWHVIVPNSLPEIFTGARVAMGVCWGTVVAAELVAADRGLGMMIVNASKFQLTDIVILGIILIGIIGYGIDILIRMAEKWLVPWKGRG